MNATIKPADKSTKNSRGWMSVTSLIISITTLGIIAFKLFKFDPSSTESFISVLVALLALCVTFVLGFQIVNILDIKESANQIKKFEQELESTKKELFTFQHEMKADHYNAIGITCLDGKNYILALCCFLKQIYHALKCDYMKGIEDGIHNSRVVLEEWENFGVYDPNNCVDSFDSGKPMVKVSEYFNIINKEDEKQRFYGIYKDDILDLKARYEKLLMLSKKIDPEE